MLSKLFSIKNVQAYVKRLIVSLLKLFETINYIY